VPAADAGRKTQISQPFHLFRQIDRIAAGHLADNFVLNIGSTYNFVFFSPPL
jgi:hypothetical protein